MEKMKKRITSSGIFVWAVLTITTGMVLVSGFVTDDESLGWTIYHLVVGVPIFLLVVVCLIVTIIERRKCTED